MNLYVILDKIFLDKIKRKTSKLRNQGSIAPDENFENFNDLVLSAIQGEVPNSKIKMLQIKFTEAIGLRMEVHAG